MMAVTIEIVTLVMTKRYLMAVDRVVIILMMLMMITKTLSPSSNKHKKRCNEKTQKFISYSCLNTNA